MSESRWIETKKECDVNDKGELITRKVILELKSKKYWGFEKKDLFELLFRLIGIIAIFIPLYLFYQQGKNEIKKQKALYQLQVYSNTTTELHSIQSKTFGSEEFEHSGNMLLYDLYPKLKLLNNPEVNDTFNVVKDILNLSTLMAAAFKSIDSLVAEYHLLKVVVNVSIDDMLMNNIRSKRAFYENFQESYSNFETKLSNSIHQLNNLNYSAKNVHKEMENYRLKALSVFKIFQNLAGDLKMFCVSNSIDSLQKALIRVNNESEFQNTQLEYATAEMADQFNSQPGKDFYNKYKTFDNLKAAYIKYHDNNISQYALKLDSVMIKSNLLLYE